MSRFHRRPSPTGDAGAVPALASGQLRALRARQEEMRHVVIVRDAFSPLTHVAGIDVGFEDDGTLTRAAVVVLNWPGLEVMEVRVARVPTSMPYVPGYLSFRELPAVMAAWEQVSERPELAFVDGLGIAHPRGLGLASHLGVTLDLPTVGVAKSRLVGEHDDPGPNAGACTPLLLHGARVGDVLRTKARCRPLFVSPGHRVSIDTATALVRAALRGYRLPEPTRLADRASATRYRDRPDAPAPEIAPASAPATAPSSLFPRTGDRP